MEGLLMEVTCYRSGVYCHLVWELNADFSV